MESNTEINKEVETEKNQNPGRSRVMLFTSPTCPVCPGAKKTMSELASKRRDIIYDDISTITPKGQRLSRKFGIRSVPTFIIKGPGYDEIIGLVGLQSEKVLNKYIDMSLGNIKQRENEEKEKKKRGFKIGKFRITF